MMLWIILPVAFAAAALIGYMLFGAAGEIYGTYRRQYVSRTAAILSELYQENSAENILTIKVLAALLGAMLVYLLMSDVMMPVPIVASAVAAGVGGMLPDMILHRQRERRRKKFNTQLIDAMNTISNGLRSGFSLMQALNLAARQLPDPIGQELRLVCHEIELGTRTEDALQNLNRRMQDRDLQLVVASVRLTTQSGGDLPAVFKRLSETIRERNRVEGKIRALTSQGRLQAIIVGLIPPALGVIVHLINPTLMELMYTTIMGWVLITLIAILDLLGYYLIRKIVTVRA